MEKSNIINYSSIFDPKYEIGINFQDKNMEFPTHTHNYIEIVCQIDGSSTHYVDDIEYTLFVNEILIINTNSTHRNLASADEVINLIISKKFLRNFVVDSGFDDVALKIKLGLQDWTHTNKYAIDVESEIILRKIYHEFTMVSVLANMKQRLLITQFLISLYEGTSIFDNIIKKEKNTNRDLISYINSNITNASLSEFAKLNHYSTASMSLKIKNEYNMSFVDVLTELRLKYAIQLLAKPELKIDDIVIQVGYQNKTHFYKLFKSKFGMTPKKLRNIEYEKLN